MFHDDSLTTLLPSVSAPPDYPSLQKRAPSIRRGCAGHFPSRFCNHGNCKPHSSLSLNLILDQVRHIRRLCVGPTTTHTADLSSRTSACCQRSSHPHTNRVVLRSDCSLCSQQTSHPRRDPDYCFRTGQLDFLSPRR